MVLAEPSSSGPLAFLEDEHMTLEQAMTKCTWELMTDEEKAVVNRAIANPTDQTLKQQVIEIQLRNMERRVALVE